MSRVVDAVLRLVDEFTKPLGNSIDMMTQAGKAGDKVRKSIGKTGESIMKMGTALTATVTAPVIGIGTASVKTAAGFEAAMSQVQATMGITKDATSLLNGQIVNTMGALGDLAKKQGKETKFSASEAADAINILAMAGMDVQSIYSMLPQTLSLAAAGGMGIAEATDIATGVMAGFGKQADETRSVVDKIAILASSAKGSVADFGNGLATVAGQAKVTGQEIDTAAVALGILGNHNIGATEGGMMLQRILKNLYQPTAKAATLMEKYGISAYTAAGEARTLQGVLKDLNEKLGGLSDQAKNDLMNQIFDTAALRGAGFLIEESGSQFDALMEKVQGASAAYGGQGAAAGQAAAQLDNLNGRITILKSGLEGAAIQLGEKLLPYAQKGVEWIQKGVDAFSSLDEETQGQIIKFAVMAAAVGPVITVFGKLVKMSTGVLGFISKLRAGTGLLGMALGAITSPAGIVIAVIGAIIAIVAVLISRMDEVKAVIAQWMPTLGPQFEELKNSLMNLGQTVGKILGPAFEMLSNIIMAVFENIMPGASVIIDGIIMAINGLTAVLGGLIDFVSGIFTGNWEKAWNGIAGIITGVIETMVGLIGSFIGKINAISSAASGAIGAVFGKKKGKTEEVPHRAAGDPGFSGGLVQVHERGGEIIDLPSGSRIYPHDRSLNMARQQAANITIAKLADQIIIREDADIDRITDALVRKLRAAMENQGGVPSATMG